MHSQRGIYAPLLALPVRRSLLSVEPKMIASVDDEHPTPIVQLTIPTKWAAAIFALTQDRLESNVCLPFARGNSLADEALAQADDDIRHIIEPDAILFRALQEAGVSSLGTTHA